MGASQIEIQLGGIGGLSPGQRPTIACRAFRAVLGGSIATLLTASMTGIFFLAP